MTWFRHLPPQPAHGRVLLGASLVVLARVVLITAYQVLGDRQAGIDGTLGLRLLEEMTGAVTALPLLAVMAGGAARWSLVDPRWRRHVAPLLALLVAFSVTHTLLMEWLRAATFPLIGETRDVSVAALRAAIAHEFPNDLFNLAIVVASVEVWRFAWRTGERQRHEAQLRAALVEAQLTALRLQLQPHFLFNALNTVSATMYDDPRRADTILGELAELLRASLRSDRNDEVPLAEEVAIAERYVRLQRERFGDRLTVAFDVPAECLRARVPVFVLQPLLENAVRHGRVERTGRGAVRVTARTDGARLVLEVWDDGDGAGAPKGGTGLGLRATAERLRLLHGGEATLDAGAVADGWRVRIALPFVTAVAAPPGGRA